MQYIIENKKNVPFFRCFWQELFNQKTCYWYHTGMMGIILIMYAYKKKSKYSRMNKFNCKIFSLYNDRKLHKFKTYYSS